MTYDPSNIFGKILRNEFAAHRVLDDDVALVIMDVFPQSRGHVQVIPKAESRNLLDANEQTLAAILPLVQKVAKAVKATTGADGIRVAQFNESVAGQTVFHLHFHIIPVYAGQQLESHASNKADDDDLAQLAASISANL